MLGECAAMKQQWPRWHVFLVKRWMLISEKQFSTGQGSCGHCECSVGCAQRQFWRHIIVWSFWTAGMCGPGHHTLPVWTHAIRPTLYGAFWKIQFTKKKSAYSLKTATRDFGSSDQRQWRKSSCSYAKSLTSASDGIHAHIKNVLRDYYSSKTVDLRDTKCSGVCYVVSQLYAMKNLVSF